MADRRQDQAFKDRIKHIVFAEGADAAFELLTREGWTVSSGQDGRCPPGYRIFATATWERRVLKKDDDDSFWAWELKR